MNIERGNVRFQGFHQLPQRSNGAGGFKSGAHHQREREVRFLLEWEIESRPWQISESSVVDTFNNSNDLSGNAAVRPVLENTLADSILARPIPPRKSFIDDYRWNTVWRI